MVIGNTKLMFVGSDVPARLNWPDSRGFGLAFDGSGFRNPQAGPEPSTTAGLGSALAQAAARGGKMQISVLQCELRMT